MSKITYTEEEKKIAAIAKALSHPARIKILQILNSQSCCFSGDMAELLPIARSTLSQHLNELKKSGLIQGEIMAPKIKYCINPEIWGNAGGLIMSFFDTKKDDSGFCCS